MIEITPCPCGSTERTENKFKDIRCKECGVLLSRRYSVESINVLDRNMSIEDAKTEIVNCVYKAACIIEALEHLGLYHGNGHHAAQDIAMFAAGRFLMGVKEGYKLSLSEKNILTEIMSMIQQVIDRGEE